MFFFYLTEYLQSFFELRGRSGELSDAIEWYFDCWIEDTLRFADGLP
ncbi:MAG: hypothetical protein LBU47_07435 [Christensenellaceae bacterium]|jgi:hypothetical protein|nr:hypothetical protein [Christensenellaceae bacterium]